MQSSPGLNPHKQNEEVNENMKTYSKENREFKFRIARLHEDEGIRIKYLAKTFKIPTQTLYGWCKQYREYGDMAFVGCGNRRQQESDLRRLQEENMRLRKENLQLKKPQSVQETGRKEQVPEECAEETPKE